MKKLFLIPIILIMFTFESCISKKAQKTGCPCQKNLTQYYIVIPENDDVDGRLLYTLVMNDGKMYEKMYAEEVANFLITGKPGYNEMLQVVEN
jgi:hypothetical protein